LPKRRRWNLDNYQKLRRRDKNKKRRNSLLLHQTNFLAKVYKMRNLRKRKPEVMKALMKVNKAKRLELKRKRREIRRTQNLILAQELKIMVNSVS
jgi:hypothetical protein